MCPESPGAAASHLQLGVKPRGSEEAGGLWEGDSLRGRAGDRKVGGWVWEDKAAHVFSLQPAWSPCHLGQTCIPGQPFRSQTGESKAV